MSALLVDGGFTRQLEGTEIGILVPAKVIYRCKHQHQLDLASSVGHGTEVYHLELNKRFSDVSDALAKARQAAERNVDGYAK